MSLLLEVKALFRARFAMRHFKTILWCVLLATVCVGAQTTVVSLHKPQLSDLLRAGIRLYAVPAATAAPNQSNVNQIACANAQSALNQLETTIAKLEQQRAQCRPVRLEPEQSNPCITSATEAINEWHKANDAQVKELTAQVARCKAGQPPLLPTPTPTPTPAPTPTANPTPPDLTTCLNTQRAMIQLASTLQNIENRRCLPHPIQPGDPPGDRCEIEKAQDIATWHKAKDAQMAEYNAIMARCPALPYPTPVPPAPGPYDLVWDSLDPNGFPLNPRWAKQDHYLKNVSNDLWNPIARPRIYENCLNAAEGVPPPYLVSMDHDYNPFENAYCKHSPGGFDSPLTSSYCQHDGLQDREQQLYQPRGAVYCSSWSWKDEPLDLKCSTDSFLGPPNPFYWSYHLSGHLNFQVVAYEGVLRWDNAQIEKEYFNLDFDDYDWCMDLYTLHGVGASSLHDDEVFIHGEVNPHEIGDGFDWGFWGLLNQTIHAAQVDCGVTSPYCQQTTDKQNIEVAPMINGKRAIFIGLLALDMGHLQAQVELHPLFGVAIHRGGSTLKGSDCQRGTPECNNLYLNPEIDPSFDVPIDANDDEWDIWAANYGQSGFCSTRALHVLDGPETIIGRDLTTMSFRLPWARDDAGNPMVNVEVLNGKYETEFTLHAAKDVGHASTNVDIDTTRHKGEYIEVTFPMPPSDDQPYWFGELHLKWTCPAGDKCRTLPPKPHSPPKTGPHPKRTSSVLAASGGKQEDRPAMKGMTEAQKQIFVAEMKKAGISLTTVPKVAITATLGTAPAPVPPANPPRFIPKTPKPVVSAEEIATWKAVCKAYGGKVPNQPANFCQQPPH